MAAAAGNGTGAALPSVTLLGVGLMGEWAIWSWLAPRAQGGSISRPLSLHRPSK